VSSGGAEGPTIATETSVLHDWARADGRKLAGRLDFLAAVAEAVDGRRGLAAGKLGTTERVLLAHPMVLARETERRRLLAFESSLSFRAERTSGIFPRDREFLRRFSPWYADQVRRLDWIGLFPADLRLQSEILAFHSLNGQLVYFKDQEPDRSVPSQESACYLPALRGRRLLLVSPFANLLRDRADRGTFEAVWARTGKRWFEPASVEALVVPYGFEPETQRRYASSLAVYEDLTDRLSGLEFDVALIGAGGLGIPLAVDAAARGQVAISLGGHLQVLFGLLGERWRRQESWRRRYINAAWLDVPDRYRPDPRNTTENYW
jgi:hypothetical protein